MHESESLHVENLFVRISIHSCQTDSTSGKDTRSPVRPPVRSLTTGRPVESNLSITANLFSPNCLLTISIQQENVAASQRRARPIQLTPNEF